MIQKYCALNKLWHPDGTELTTVPDNALFDYSNYKSLSTFNGTHPEVMKELIKRHNFKINLNASIKRFSLRDKLLYYFERVTGYRLFEYKNFKII
jgi:hypothetical protein